MDWFSKFWVRSGSWSTSPKQRGRDLARPNTHIPWINCQTTFGGGIAGRWASSGYIILIRVMLITVKTRQKQRCAPPRFYKSKTLLCRLQIGHCCNLTLAGQGLAACMGFILYLQNLGTCLPSRCHNDRWLSWVGVIDEKDEIPLLYVIETGLRFGRDFDHKCNPGHS